MSELRIALVQHGSLHEPIESLERAKKLLSRLHREVDIAVFPEYSMLDPTGLDARVIRRAAENTLEQWIEFYQKTARELGIIIIGHVFEPAREADKVYNTVVVIEGGKGVVAKYRKTHLFDAYGYRESSFTEPGEKLSSVVDVAGFHAGFAVCFELRYPEIFRYLALQGVDIVVVPAAWYRGPLKEETLAFLARARAHENTIYVAVAANFNDNFTGRSMLVDPYGVVVAEAGAGNKIVYAEASKDSIAEARTTLPLLSLRRPSLYKGVFQ